MADSAPSILWIAFGKPDVEGCGPASGPCYQCAGPVEQGISVRDWMSSNYTDQNRVRCADATHVCSGCVMLSRRLWPVPGRPAGKCKGCDGTGQVTNVAKKGKTRNSQVGDLCPKCEGSGQASAGGNFRNYSTLYESGWNAPALPDGTVMPGYLNASKGEKPLVRAFLERRHEGTWFAAIADSGQKHVVPWAPLNAPGKGGLVIFEETLVRVPRSLELIEAMTALLTAGGTKDEIIDGEYRPNTWNRCQEAIEAFESKHGKLRHSGWFNLAIWLAQRDEEQVAVRQEQEKQILEAKKAPKGAKKSADKRTKSKGGDAAGGDDPGGAPRVHSSEERVSSTRILGPTAGHDRSGDERAVDRGVGAKPAKRPTDKGVGQIRLPGFG